MAYFDFLTSFPSLFFQYKVMVHFFFSTISILNLPQSQHNPLISHSVLPQEGPSLFLLFLQEGHELPSSSQDLILLLHLLRDLQHQYNSLMCQSSQSSQVKACNSRGTSPSPFPTDSNEYRVMQMFCNAMQCNAIVPYGTPFQQAIYYSLHFYH